MAESVRASCTTATLIMPFITVFYLIHAPFLVGLFPSASAFQIFPEGSVSEFSTPCAAALSTNITACSNVVVGLDPSETYDQSLLESFCNATCGSALSSWQENVTNACSGVTYTDDYGFDTLVSSIPGLMAFNFNQTCLMNAGEYCNVVLGNITTAAANASSTVGQCNECDLLMLRNTAQSPYGDGPLVLSQGLYQSYTSICGYSVYPLTTMPPAPTSMA